MARHRGTTYDDFRKRHTYGALAAGSTGARRMTAMAHALVVLLLPEPQHV